MERERLSPNTLMGQMRGLIYGRELKGWLTVNNATHCFVCQWLLGNPCALFLFDKLQSEGQRQSKELCMLRLYSAQQVFKHQTKHLYH